MEDPLRVIFGINATEALNLGIQGILKKGDHVITSSMEHNSVMRPLRDLEDRGVVDLTVIQCQPDGSMHPEAVEAAIRKDTRMIVLNHASNVVGTILPIREVGRINREHENIMFLLDTAQTAGALPIDMNADHIDLLAFTGHKALLGPQGTGGLVINETVDIRELTPLKQGGTGSRSELEHQPEFLPDRYESGTMNAVGLAGLAASVEWILNETIDRIHEKEVALSRHFIQRMQELIGDSRIHPSDSPDGDDNRLSGDLPITLYGTADENRQTSTFSFNIRDLSQSEIGLHLDEEFDIMCRVGLHCAPSAHRTIGTFPHGTVRFGMGYLTTEEEVDIVLDAVRKLTQGIEK